MEDKALVIHGEDEPSGLIRLAIEKGADLATIEKLMDLQERYEAGNARKAYTAAMAGFKQEAPAVMIKGDRANFGAGKAAYTYANLGSIAQEISALLGKYSLSASWETAQDEKGLVVVSCHITHVAGHRETVTLKGPSDTSGSKNPIQAIGSTVTYLQRYTLLAVLGLATGEDPDGMPPPREPIQQPQATTGKAEPLTAKGIIEDVKIHEGTTKAGKHYKKWGVDIKGATYGTFDTAIGEAAESCKGAEVVVSYKAEGQFFTIIELVPVMVGEPE